MRIPFFSKAEPKTNILRLNEYDAASTGVYKYNYLYSGRYGSLGRYFPLDMLMYPALYSVLSKITSSIACLPIQAVDAEGHLYDKVTAGVEKARINRIMGIFNRPNLYYPIRYNFFERIVSDLVMDGNAYLYAGKNNGGELLTLNLATPQSVTISRLSDDRLRYHIQLDDHHQVLAVTNNEVTHIKIGQHYQGYDLDAALRGIPPLLVLSSSVDIGRQSDQYIKQFFRNSTNGEVFLTIPDKRLTDEQMNQAMKKIEKCRRDGKSTISLLEGVEPKFQNQKSAQDKGLKDLRDQQVRFVASAYGLPPELCGVGDVKSIEITNRLFYRHCLIKYITAIEEAFSNLLPAGFYFKFDLTQFLRGDTDTTLKLVQAGLGGSQTQPFMTRNEARRMLGLTPMPDDDFDEIKEAVVVEAGGNASADNDDDDEV